MNKLTTELRVLEEQLAELFTAKPEEGTESARIFSTMTAQVKKKEEEILAAVKAGPASSALEVIDGTMPNTSTAQWRQNNLMSSYVAGLKFSGRDDEDINEFLFKIKAIGEACNLIPFSEIWAAARPQLPSSMLRAVDGAKIDDYKTLKETLSKLFGSHQNAHQRLEAWMNKEKRWGMSFVQHHAELSGKLNSIKASYAEMLKERHSSHSGDRFYTPTWDDAFQILEYLKVLQDCRGQSDSIFKTLSIELSQIKTPTALAMRAEQIRSQVPTQSRALNVSNNKKGNNKSQNKGNHNNSSDNNQSHSKPSTPKGGDRPTKDSQGNSQHNNNTDRRVFDNSRGGRNFGGNNNSRSNNNNWNKKRQGDNKQYAIQDTSFADYENVEFDHNSGDEETFDHTYGSKN
jgi:hypothetical protein